MIAGILDYFGYGFNMVVLIGLPAAGLVVNIASMQRQGLNRKAGLAACLFFLTLMVQGATVTLGAQNAFPLNVHFWLLAGSGLANIVSAILALWALWQIRRKHRWSRGRKRAITIFWLNIFILGFMGAAFFLWTRPDLEQKIFG